MMEHANHELCVTKGTNMRPHTAIIGAGIAGLSAAYELQKAGLSSVVLEKEGFVGGRMSSELLEGFVIDRAAYTLPEFHRSLVGFIEGLGMKDSLVQTPATSSTFAGKREHQIKIGRPTDFLKYKLLSAKNKKDMIKLFVYAQSLGRSLNLKQPSEKTFALELETAAEFLLKHYDKEILERVAYPIFCELFLGTPENNSIVAFLAIIRNLTRFKIFSLDKGMGLVCDRVASELNVRLHSPVLAVSKQRTQAGYEVHVGGSNPETLCCDAVIFTVPPPIIPHILESISTEMADLFRGVRYAPSIVVALATERRYNNTSMINNLGREDNRVVGTMVFDHHKGPKRVPEGKGLATAILREEASRALFHESDEKIIGETVKDIDALFSAFSDGVLFARVYRWEHGAVQLPPGALARQVAARTTLEREFHDIHFAGDGFYQASLEVSHKSGISAARRIIAAS